MNDKARAAAEEIDALLATRLPPSDYVCFAPANQEMAAIICRHFPPTAPAPAGVGIRATAIKECADAVRTKAREFRKKKGWYEILSKFADDMEAVAAEGATPAPAEGGEVPRIAGRITERAPQGRCIHGIILTNSCYECLESLAKGEGEDEPL